MGTHFQSDSNPNGYASNPFQLYRFLPLVDLLYSFFVPFLLIKSCTISISINPAPTSNGKRIHCNNNYDISVAKDDRMLHLWDRGLEMIPGDPKYRGRDTIGEIYPSDRSLKKSWQQDLINVESVDRSQGTTYGSCNLVCWTSALRYLFFCTFDLANFRACGLFLGWTLSEIPNVLMRIVECTSKDPYLTDKQMTFDLRLAKARRVLLFSIQSSPTALTRSNRIRVLVKDNCCPHLEKGLRLSWQPSRCRSEKRDTVGKRPTTSLAMMLVVRAYDQYGYLCRS